MGLGQSYGQGATVPSLQGQEPYPSGNTTSCAPERHTGRPERGKEDCRAQGEAHAALTATTAQRGASALPQGREQLYGMPQACPTHLPKALPRRGLTHTARAIVCSAHLCLSQQTAPSGRWNLGEGKQQVTPQFV